MNYLRVQSGRLLLLLPAHGILEVVDDASNDQESSRHALWRGQVLPKVSLRHFFGETRAAVEPIRIVHDGGDGEPLVYLADAVLGLSQLEEEDFLDLPRLNEPWSAWFDRVYSEPGERGLMLRCCLPFAEPAAVLHENVKDEDDQTADCG